MATSARDSNKPRGLLGSVAKYDDLKFKEVLKEGFSLGVMECKARNYATISADTEDTHKKRLKEMRARYQKNNLNLEVPVCDEDTVWMIEDFWTERLRHIQEIHSGQGHEYGSYLMIGHSAGLFFGGCSQDRLKVSIRQLNTIYPNAQVSEEPLLNAILRLPVQNQGYEDFLTALKRMLHSSHANERIVFVAACPNRMVGIRPDREYSAITKRLECATHWPSIQLRSVEACSLKDMLRAFRRYKPTILHFSGHANAKGLCFEDEKGELDYIETRELVDAMRLGVKYGLHTVVLNACYTAEECHGIANVVGRVIAVKTELYDHVAELFSGVFYEGIGEGYAVEDAFDWASQDPNLSKYSEELRPLIVRAGAKPHTSSAGGTNQNRNDSNDASYAGLAIGNNPDGHETVSEENGGSGAEEDDISGSDVESEEDSEEDLEESADAREENLGNMNAQHSDVVDQRQLHVARSQAKNDAAGSVDTEVRSFASQDEPTTSKPNAGILTKPAPTQEPSIDPTPTTAEGEGLSMLDQLKLRARQQRRGVNETDLGELGETTVPRLATRSAPSTNPNPRAAFPHQSRDTPTSYATKTGTKPTTTRPIDPVRHHSFLANPFLNDPLFNDPFFTSQSQFGSILHHMLLGTSRGPSNPQAAQIQRNANARSSTVAGPTTAAGRGVNTSGVRAAQPPVRLSCGASGCGKLITAKGMTCEDCTNCQQVACLDCAAKLPCLPQNHKVFLVTLPRKV